MVGPSRDGGAHDYGDAGMGEGKEEAAAMAMELRHDKSFN